MYACMHAVREMGREDKHRDRQRQRILMQMWKPFYF